MFVVAVSSSFIFCLAGFHVMLLLGGLIGLPISLFVGIRAVGHENRSILQAASGDDGTPIVRLTPRATLVARVKSVVSGATCGIALYVLVSGAFYPRSLEDVHVAVEYLSLVVAVLAAVHVQSRVYRRIQWEAELARRAERGEPWLPPIRDEEEPEPAAPKPVTRGENLVLSIVGALIVGAVSFPVGWVLAAFTLRSEPKLAGVPFRAAVAIAAVAAIVVGLRSYLVRARKAIPRTAAGVG